MTPWVIARRQVVLLPFPFSDLSAQKLRPALVLADAGKGDWLNVWTVFGQSREGLIGEMNEELVA